VAWQLSSRRWRAADQAAAPPVGEELAPRRPPRPGQPPGPGDLALERADLAAELARRASVDSRFGQGFHFARPLDQFAVEALLVAEQGRRTRPAPRARSRT
jgi:hypothetical protein